jgi:hypothetical protein
MNEQFLSSKLLKRVEIFQSLLGRARRGRQCGGTLRPPVPAVGGCSGGGSTGGGGYWTPGCRTF